MTLLRRFWSWLINSSDEPSPDVRHLLERASELERRQRIFEEQFRVDSATRRGERG